MRNSVKLALPLVALLLVGCGVNDSSSGETSATESGATSETTSQTSNSEEIKVPEFHDVKSAILAMQEVDNFYIEKQFGGDSVPYYKGEFAKNYFYEYNANVGFMEKDDIVMPFYFNEKGDLINKEPLQAKHVFGEDGVIPNMDLLDVKYVGAGNTFESQKRTFIKPLLNILGYNADNVYNSLTGPVKFAFVEGGLDITVNFQVLNMEVGQMPVVDNVKIRKIGLVKNDLVEDFIKNGTVHVLDPRLIKVRELFAANNFRQYQYDEENIFQVDYFHPNYYATMFTKHAISKVPALTMQQYGYVVISSDQPLDLLKDNEGNPIPLLFDDTYKYQFFGDNDNPGDNTLISIPHPHRPGYAAGAFQEVIKDIPDAFHYPIGLALFDNLDLMQVESSNSFATTHKGIIDNFVMDFNIGESLAPYGGCVKLEMEVYLSKTDDSKSKVTFKAIVNGGGYFLIEIKDFGAANFTPFEDLLASLK